MKLVFLLFLLAGLAALISAQRGGSWRGGGIGRYRGGGIGRFRGGWGGRWPGRIGGRRRWFGRGGRFRGRWRRRGRWGRRRYFGRRGGFRRGGIGSLGPLLLGSGLAGGDYWSSD